MCSNCKENSIPEGIRGTVPAFPSCSCEYLRLRTDNWMPISVGAVFVLKCFLPGCAHFRISVCKEGKLLFGNSFFGSAVHELVVQAVRFAQTGSEEVAGM